MTRGRGRGSAGRRGGNSSRGGNGNSGRGNTATRVNMPSVPMPTVSLPQAGTSSSHVPDQINVQSVGPSNVPPVQTSRHNGTATIRSEPTPFAPNQSNPIGEGTSSQSNATGEGEASNISVQRSLLFLTPAGLEPSRSCADVITDSFQVEIDYDGINWKSVSDETKNFYYGEFKKKFYWDSSIEGAVRIAWRKKAGTRYSDFLCRIKGKRIKPTFVSEEIWENWLQLWEDPLVVKKSETASRNRCASGNGVAVGTHTGGSITIGEHRKRYAIDKGKDPLPSELHLHVHTHGNDGKSFVGERSRIVHERFEEIVQQQALTQSEVNQVQAYLEAAGGAKKQKVFGLGSQAKSYYGQNFRVSSGSDASSSVPPSNAQSIPIGNLEELILQLIPTLADRMVPVITERVKEMISPPQDLPTTPTDLSSSVAPNAPTAVANVDDCHSGSDGD